MLFKAKANDRRKNLALRREEFVDFDLMLLPIRIDGHVVQKARGDPEKIQGRYGRPSEGTTTPHSPVWECPVRAITYTPSIMKLSAVCRNQQQRRTATRELLATDHIILNHGQVTWTTPELAPPLLTTTPHEWEDVSALDRLSVHRCPTRWVFSGTGLELVTKPATIRYLYLLATAARLCPEVHNGQLFVIFQLQRQVPTHRYREFGSQHVTHPLQIWVFVLFAAA
ncbi:uncharacterized protein TNCV_3923761 [Trichonephila clavipes]|nr:uncharacterized protein TNCV_3923761 [Trichonephila clavipes]